MSSAATMGMARHPSLVPPPVVATTGQQGGASSIVMSSMAFQAADGAKTGMARPAQAPQLSHVPMLQPVALDMQQALQISNPLGTLQAGKVQAYGLSPPQLLGPV